MTRTTSRLLSVTACLAVLACASIAAAQTSDARIQELIRQVKTAPPPTITLSPQLAPDANGPVVPLTIDDAVRLALERNLDIAVQRMGPELADITIAQSLTAYRPTVTADFNRSSTTSAPTSQLQLSSGGSGVTNHNLGYNGTYTQLTPWWGGNIRANLNNSRSDSNSNNATFNPSYQSTWTLTYSQPLLRGRSVDATRRTITVAKINRDISDVQLKSQLSNLVSDVRNSYWDYVYAVQAVEAANQSLALATKLVDDNKVKVEIGTLAPLEVTTAQAEQAQREQTVVNAVGARKIAETNLKRLIVSGTDDPNWRVSLDPIDRPEFLPEDVDVEAAIRRALNERTDVTVVRKTLDINAESLKYLRDQTRPEIDVSANYGTQGVGGTFLQRSNTGVLGSTVTNTIPGGIGDAFSSLFSNANPRWSVGLSVSYPIGVNAPDTQLARANVMLNQINAQLKKMELQVATDITNAANNLNNAAQAVRVAQKSRELSEQRRQAEQSKFDVGMSTNYQVVQAQRDLQDAVNSELRAILNYRKSQVEFERAQQTLGNVTISQIN